MNAATTKRKAELERELKKIRVQDEKDRRAAEYAASQKKLGRCYIESFGDSAFILRKLISVKEKEPTLFTMDAVYIQVRREGLVIGWRKSKLAEIMKCTNSEKTRQLVYKDGKWVKQKV